MAEASEAHTQGEKDKDRQAIFVRPFPTTSEERLWLIDTYGMPQPGPDGWGYVYHGTSAEARASIEQMGLFGVPDQPTFSTLADNEAKATAGNRGGQADYNVVAVFKAPWATLDLVPNSWPEPVGWPKDKYTGERENLPIHPDDKNNPELRVLDKKYLIGFYTVARKK